jgi:hypothetical protein
MPIPALWGQSPLFGGQTPDKQKYSTLRKRMQEKISGEFVYFFSLLI